MYCPKKFSIVLCDEKGEVVKKYWGCEGIDCELFNQDYGRCSEYIKSLTIDERVKLLQPNNSGRKK